MYVDTFVLMFLNVIALHCIMNIQSFLEKGLNDHHGFAEKRKEETARQEVRGKGTPVTFDLIYNRKMVTGRRDRGSKRMRES